jgi:hypothetical protein
VKSTTSFVAVSAAMVPSLQIAVLRLANVKGRTVFPTEHSRHPRLRSVGWNTGAMPREAAMKDFSNASFPPEMITVMQEALDDAVSTLPMPVDSSHVQSIAESILRTTKEGERDPTMLKTMALLELQITPRD